MDQLLFVHNHNQNVDLNFWRIVVSDNLDIKEQIEREVHSTPHSAHPRIKQTIAKVRRSLF